ncbi:hypothetical protein [Mesorhizobium sp. M1252]
MITLIDTPIGADHDVVLVGTRQGNLGGRHEGERQNDGPDHASFLTDLG